LYKHLRYDHFTQRSLKWIHFWKWNSSLKTPY